MKWYRIPEIDPVDYAKCLRSLYNIHEGKHISKSEVDPFMKGMRIGLDNISESKWNEMEKDRLKTKSFEGAMGYFHQDIMGKFPGWETLPPADETECDVMKKDRKAIIESKNKSNTCNSGGNKDVIRKLSKQLDNGVERAICAKVNCPDDKVSGFKAEPRIEVMSGKQVYEFLSGRETFFEDLKATFVDTFKMFKTYDELTAVTGIPIVEDPAIVSCREVEACRVGGVWNKEKLMKKTGGDLKVWCKQNKLKLTGKKEELVNRVLESGV